MTENLVDVYGVMVKTEKLGRDELPERLANFIDGGLGNEGLGSYLRTLSDRIAEEYTGRGGYFHRPEIIHMSDVYNCLLSSYLKRQHPDWLDRFPDERWSKRMHMKRGAILNAGITSLFPTSEKDVSYPLPEVNASLTGRLDFVDKGICWELKRSSDFAVSKIKKEGPYVPHIQQVHFYSFCRKYEARLLYWHSHGLDIYHLDLGGRDEVVSELVERAIRLHRHLKKGNPPEPEPEYGWSCDLCDFGRKTCGDQALCDGEKVELVGEGPDD